MMLTDGIKWCHFCSLEVHSVALNVNGVYRAGYGFIPLNKSVTFQTYKDTTKCNAEHEPPKITCNVMYFLALSLLTAV